METSSISSSVRGRMPAASTAEVARAAVSVESKSTSAVFTCRGSGKSCTVISVAMPSVPSEPTSSPVRS